MPTLSPEDDPLQWWKVEAKRLPILATLARKYLYVAPVCRLSVYLARQVTLLVIYELVYLLLM